jgi:hypothetical protein
MTVADILERAADLIEPEGKWTQQFYARDASGSRVPEYTANAVCWCASGAILRTAGDWTSTECGAAHRFLVSAVGASIPEWNDAPGRTQAEVVSALREAAAKAREAGK